MSVDGAAAVELEAQEEEASRCRQRREASESHARVSEREMGLRSMKEDAPPPMRLDFRDVVYDVRVGTPGEEVAKRILHGVSGSVRPGEFLAVMGPTGAGKSTLLNLLAGQEAHAAGAYGGEVRLNGRARTKAMKRHTAYCPQDDSFFPNLSVRETLTFSALLRLPSTLSVEQKHRRVDRVLRMLNIGKVADSTVGGMMVRGISGGERRRLSIGTEVITNPSLLLCDEPTSGLDSATAHAVVDTLVDMAHAGRAVVATLHQPSSIMFAKFDKLLLLAEGRVIFHGPAAEAADYFERQGFPCPRAFNVADHMLELVTAEQLRGASERIGPLADAYARHCAEVAADGGAVEPETARDEVRDKPRLSLVDVDLHDGGGGGGGKAPLDGAGSSASALGAGDEDEEAAAGAAAGLSTSRWGNSFWFQFRVLLHRAYIQTRGERIQPLYLAQFTILSVVVGLVWFQMDRTEDQIQDRIGMIFFTTVFWCFTGLFNSMMSFPPERPVVSKERAAGSYRLSAYFLARCLADLPVDSLYPTLFTTVAYWMAGLRNDFEYFLAYLAVVHLVHLSSGGVGVLIAAGVTDFKKSLVTANVLILTSMLLGGFYADPQGIPVWVRWVQYLSPVKYAYQLNVAIDFRGTHFECAESSAFSHCDGSPGAAIPGEAVIARDGLDDIPPGVSVAVLVAFGVLSRYAAYLLLRKNK